MRAPSRRTWRTIAGVLVIVLVGAWWLFGSHFTGSSNGNGSGSQRTGSQQTQAGKTPARTTSGDPKGGDSKGSKGTDPDSGLPLIAAADLPNEARQTITLIDKGGPFPYDKDGSSFGNFEGVLPAKPRGYYKEYTVSTPGEKDRGARRIVSGNNDKELFWTADHYAHFARISR